MSAQVIAYHPDDLDEYLTIQQGRSKGPVCGVTRALQLLNPVESAKLQRALDTQSIEHQTIALVLRGKGLTNPPDASAIGRHRRGACKCSPS